MKRHKFSNNYTFLGLLLLLLGCPFISSSQELSITSIATQGDLVIINYDLDDEEINHRYTLSLYASIDNYVQPLEKVDGDIGVDIEVGGSKEIIWRAKEELGSDFTGDVALELKGKLYVPFIELTDFDRLSKFKRGRLYNLTWSAGRGNDVLNIDLFNQKGEIVNTYTNVANVGEYEMIIPKDTRPGDEYRMRFRDQKNKEDVVYTPTFVVRRKIPLFLQVLAGGAVATLTAVTLNNGEAAVAAGESEIVDPVLPK